MSDLPDKEVFAKTIFAECRGEPHDGQLWVIWVIKNRVNNRDWPNTIKDVCLQPWQFECWTDPNSTSKQYRQKTNIETSVEPARVYNDIKALTDSYFDVYGEDPTGGCLYYNNPDDPNERHSMQQPEHWTNKVQKVKKIGHHQFYR